MPGEQPKARGAKCPPRGSAVAPASARTGNTATTGAPTAPPAGPSPPRPPSGSTSKKQNCCNELQVPKSRRQTARQNTATAAQPKSPQPNSIHRLPRHTGPPPRSMAGTLLCAQPPQHGSPKRTRVQKACKEAPKAAARRDRGGMPPPSLQALSHPGLSPGGGAGAQGHPWAARRSSPFASHCSDECSNLQP